mgnify:CR=1 FL=1
MKENGKNKLNHIKEIQSKNHNDKSIEKCIEVYENDVKKQKEKKEKKGLRSMLRVWSQMLKSKSQPFEKISLSPKKQKHPKPLDNQSKILKAQKSTEGVTKSPPH